jgi:hypothetical protein
MAVRRCLRRLAVAAAALGAAAAAISAVGRQRQYLQPQRRQHRPVY